LIWNIPYRSTGGERVKLRPDDYKLRDKINLLSTPSRTVILLHLGILLERRPCFSVYI